MSLTQVATVTYNTGMHVSLWQQKVLIQAGEKLFWEKLAGPPGSGMPIIRNDDLTVKAGGIVNIPMQRRMTGGVTGNSALSGSEEAMVFDNLAVTPVYNRNAAAAHEQDRQKTIADLMEQAGLASGIWLAEKIDDTIFGVLDAQTTNRLYGGDATSKATIEAADVMTAALLRKARAKAKAVHIRPLIIDGREWYIVVMHPFQAYSLGADATWLPSNYYAQNRGADNPIIGMTMGAYQGLLIFENDRVESGADAGSGGNLDYAIAHLVGADAVGFAWSMLPQYIQETRDYGSIIGRGAKAMFGAAAAVFNSVPVGHVPIMTYATDPT